MMHVLPTALDVEAAHERLRDWLIETPVLESELLNQRAGVRVLLKAESLQHDGQLQVARRVESSPAAQACGTQRRSRGVLVG